MSKGNADAARMAAIILRPHSVWIPKEAEFDREKVKRLVSIFDTGNLPDNFISDLIQRTQSAVIDLWTAKSDKPREAIKRLTRLGKAARELCDAWSDLGHDMQRTLGCHMEGRFPTSKNKTPVELIMKLNDRTKRIEEVAGSDLWAIIGGASELIEVLRKNSAHSPAEYLCVITIAKAWEDCTGAAPTLTRNEDAVSGDQKTLFQTFLTEALAPLEIGERVIRTAIQALSIGDKSFVKSENLSPKE
jgi:hypothetical protein